LLFWTTKNFVGKSLHIVQHDFLVIHRAVVYVFDQDYYPFCCTQQDFNNIYIQIFILICVLQMEEFTDYRWYSWHNCWKCDSVLLWILIIARQGRVADDRIPNTLLTLMTCCLIAFGFFSKIKYTTAIFQSIFICIPYAACIIPIVTNFRCVTIRHWNYTNS
jgi:hypothetical protein